MFLQTFQPNTLGADYVVGDLHGMYDLLLDALAKVNFNTDRDRCFSVGDLVDRGPDSEKCLNLIHQPWFFAVKGNHEEILINITRNSGSYTKEKWLIAGGHWHEKVATSQMHQYANWLDQLPYIIYIDSNPFVAICHAEYPLNQWLPQQVAGDPKLKKALQWSRSRIKEQDTSIVTGIDHIFCGHTIVKKPLVLGNHHFIDTGAYKSEQLTLKPLPT